MPRRAVAHRARDQPRRRPRSAPAKPAPRRFGPRAARATP